MRYTVTGTNYSPDIDLLEEEADELKDAIALTELMVEDGWQKVKLRDKASGRETQVWPPEKQKQGNGRGFADQYKKQLYQTPSPHSDQNQPI